MFGFLRALWTYRGFIGGSVKREFQLKYRNSLLGAAWTVLNPLSMILVYTLVFSRVMHARMPHASSPFAYSIYLCAGVLTWGFFAEVTGRGKGIFLDNANLIKKLNFPRICLPVIGVIGAGINFVIIFSLFVVFLLINRIFPGWVFLDIFPLLCIQVLFSLGITIILGVLNVFFRDTGQFYDVIIQFWFWLTPIVYPSSVLPAGIKKLMILNPMYPLMVAYQSILLNGKMTDWKPLLVPAISGLVLCVFGLVLFRRRSGEMVDEL